MADMQNFRVCLELAAVDPTHLDRGLPETAITTTAPEVAAVEACMAGVAEGLQSFELHPKGEEGKQIYSGIDKFDHLVKLARRSMPARSTLAPSAYLDVEFSCEQQRLLDPMPIDFAMHALMAATTHGAGAQRKLARRKYDNLGYVRGQCGFANDPERMKRLRNQLALADAMAEMTRRTADEKSTKASMATAELVAAAPIAIAKLKGHGGNLTKLTMKEMEAIAFTSFNGAVLKGDKTAHVAALEKLASNQPAILEAASAAMPPPLPAPTKAKGKAPAKTATQSSDDDMSSDNDEAEQPVGSSDEEEDEEDADSDEEVPPPLKVKLGVVVHIPHSVFPEETRPELGYWVGKTVFTNKGGALDVGILAQGEDEVFTRSLAEVVKWIV